MSNKLRPEERLKGLEDGIGEVLTEMAESRQAFGSREIKDERKTLNERLKHHREEMSAETRIAMLVDKLLGTAIVLNAVLKQRRSQKLLAAKERAEALLIEFIGADAFDQQSKGHGEGKIHDEVERMFNAMVKKTPPNLKDRFKR